MKEQKVRDLVEEAVLENDSLFLIDVLFLANNKIRVIVDGDEGIPIKECIRINRYIENNLDREEEDFALEVTSPDISHPLLLLRQYQKNIGRILKVKTEEEKYEGTLTNVTDKEIVLEWKAREPKPIGKGKVTVAKKISLEYTHIKEAKVKIIF
ncbi:ribosome maturation factor RimP [Lutibacter sp. Hel_I_33_5]|uniref:ribosome assembly cofactor RimP n=1 Tax=Lutibacter sp. Hel_I_33_5 TaxID=1566289 RepID=UPI0011A91953|nr:ribosome assembly cofactor RimP [Lutibacter sp. Hel_I_33_5]TVZ56118.1 ribosome maturation factor RimP [Lutibacter sp. Hel_I_33_5]